MDSETMPEPQVATAEPPVESADTEPAAATIPTEPAVKPVSPPVVEPRLEPTAAPAAKPNRLLALGRLLRGATQSLLTPTVGNTPATETAAETDPARRRYEELKALLPDEIKQLATRRDDFFKQMVAARKKIIKYGALADGADRQVTKLKQLCAENLQKGGNAEEKWARSWRARIIQRDSLRDLVGMIEDSTLPNLEEEHLRAQRELNTRLDGFLRSQNPAYTDRLKEAVARVEAIADTEAEARDLISDELGCGLASLMPDSLPGIPRDNPRWEGRYPGLLLRPPEPQRQAWIKRAQEQRQAEKKAAPEPDEPPTPAAEDDETPVVPASEEIPVESEKAVDSDSGE